MAQEWLARQNMLIGEENTAKLQGSRVAVIGLGGVGGAVVEALARAGVGHLLLVDGDTISETNKNRQLIATTETIGMEKIRAWGLRVLSINPGVKIETSCCMVRQGEDGGLVAFRPHYIVDAIDTVSSKIFLIELCKEHNLNILCCMGTGNRVDTNGFAIADISETSGCPVARVLRKELRSREIENVTVLYNKNPPQSAAVEKSNGRHAPGSISYVPPIAGFMAAEYVIKQLMQAEG